MATNCSDSLKTQPQRNGGRGDWGAVRGCRGQYLRKARTRQELRICISAGRADGSEERGRDFRIHDNTLWGAGVGRGCFSSRLIPAPERPALLGSSQSEGRGGGGSAAQWSEPGAPASGPTWPCTSPAAVGKEPGETTTPSVSLWHSEGPEPAAGSARRRPQGPEKALELARQSWWLRGIPECTGHRIRTF